jgi:hypothetical protein
MKFLVSTLSDMPMALATQRETLIMEEMRFKPSPASRRPVRIYSASANPTGETVIYAYGREIPFSEFRYFEIAGLILSSLGGTRQYPKLITFEFNDGTVSSVQITAIKWTDGQGNSLLFQGYIVDDKDRTIWRHKISGYTDKCTPQNSWLKILPL